MSEELTVIVLAAGEGKRMKSALPKMLHPLLGRTLIGHVLTTVAALRPARTIVVIGHGADQMSAHLAEVAPGVATVLQERQGGTGHATRVAMEAMPVRSGTTIVVNGDFPLLRPQTVLALVDTHRRTGATATILTAVMPDPAGLGRVLREPTTGMVEAIVESADATPDQLGIAEINAGLYAFDTTMLVEALGKLTTQNGQGEEYVTDVIGLLVGSGQIVAAHTVADSDEVIGCNDRVELAETRAVLRDRINREWMREGVTIVDPATTWIDATVTLGRDTVIEPNTHLRGQTSVGEGALIGPDTTIADTSVGDGAEIIRAHVLGAVVGAGASVGPYAYLRPGTTLGARAKVGTFVEVKNSDIGTGTKIPHLSYVGDATIGEESNLGAATVTANYGGVDKNRTTIGSHVRIGVDNMLVAPVTVGDGAYTAAGSVITEDVPPGALGVARSRQRNIDGWVALRRPGSSSARAADAAKIPSERGAGTPPDPDGNTAHD